MKTEKLGGTKWFSYYGNKGFCYVDSKTDIYHPLIYHGLYNNLNKYIGYHYQHQRKGFWITKK